MTKLITLARAILPKLAAAGLFWLSFLSPVYAQVPDELERGAGEARPEGAPGDLVEVFKDIVNTIIFIIGAIAVLMLIIGGIRYVISAGNEQQVAGAKNTILYAIIGIVVAVIAFAAVNFVIDQLAQ